MPWEEVLVYCSRKLERELEMLQLEREEVQAGKLKTMGTEDGDENAESSKDKG